MKKITHPTRAIKNISLLARLAKKIASDLILLVVFIKSASKRIQTLEKENERLLEENSVLRFQNNIPPDKVILPVTYSFSEFAISPEKIMGMPLIKVLPNSQSLTKRDKIIKSRLVNWIQDANAAYLVGDLLMEFKSESGYNGNSFLDRRQLLRQRNLGPGMVKIIKASLVYYRLIDDDWRILVEVPKRIESQS